MQMTREQKVSRCGGPDGVGAAMPAGLSHGRTKRPLRDMEASRMASMEPATKRANRGSGTGAVGDSHGNRRADAESDSCRCAASAERKAL
jgi:hypothetical protein